MSGFCNNHVSRCVTGIGCLNVINRTKLRAVVLKSTDVMLYSDMLVRGVKNFDKVRPQASILVQEFRYPLYI